MHLTVILRITGTLLTLFSFSFLLPALVALIYAEVTLPTFFSAFGITLVSGLILWLPLRGKRELRGGDGFLVTALFYLGLGMFGAIPFWLADATQLSFTDAVFESISGLTTTGATTIIGLDNLPKSLLIYRQMLQWMGGMGIIVLAVAIYPMLGIGGMQLYRTESAGPMKDNKLTPRITETAKALWYLYIGLTAACALAYWLAGMSGFDAIAHSFSTVSIGGFSTHDMSMGYFDSGAVETVAIVFMTLSGINFALHFLVWRRRNPLHYFQDIEVRVYLFVLALVSAIVCSILWWQPTDTDDALRDDDDGEDDASSRAAAAARDPAAASRDDSRARDRRATPSSLPSDEASLLQEERDALRSAYELVVAERDDARAIRELARNAERDAARRLEASRRRHDARARHLRRAIDVIEHLRHGRATGEDVDDFLRACRRETERNDDDNVSHECLK